MVQALNWRSMGETSVVELDITVSYWVCLFFDYASLNTGKADFFKRSQMLQVLGKIEIPHACILN